MLSCSRDPVSNVDGDKVTLYFDQSVTFGSDKIKIGFDSLLAESRCPDNALVLCFWQGMAEIRVWLLEPGLDTVYIALGIEGLTDYPESDSYPAVDTLGLSLELIKLNPYPEDPDHMAPQSRYVATLKVTPEEPGENIDGVVRIVDIPPTVLLLDDYELEMAGIDGDYLDLRIRYGGGCKKHYFFLYMSPDAFMESNPLQVNLYLQHYANNDMCEAYIARELRFELTPIAELYRNTISPGGTVMVNMYEYYEDTPGNKISVPYYIAYPPD